MPPIYSFSIPGYEEESGWGWHKVSELVEAVNNIRLSQFLSPLLNEQIAREFAYTGNFNRVHQGMGIQIEYLPLVNSSIYLERICGEAEKEENGPPYKLRNLTWSLDSHWLYYAANDSFFPAKLGMKLLEAVKNRRKHVIRKAVKFLIKS